VTRSGHLVFAFTTAYRPDAADSPGASSSPRTSFAEAKRPWRNFVSMMCLRSDLLKLIRCAYCRHPSPERIR